MSKFKAKPIILEAVQFTGNVDEFEGLIYCDSSTADPETETMINIYKLITERGDIFIDEGDWVVTEPNGTMQVCSQELVDLLYEVEVN